MLIDRGRTTVPAEEGFGSFADMREVLSSALATIIPDIDP